MDWLLVLLLMELALWVVGLSVAWLWLKRQQRRRRHAEVEAVLRRLGMSRPAVSPGWGINLRERLESAREESASEGSSETEVRSDPTRRSS